MFCSRVRCHTGRKFNKPQIAEKQTIKCGPLNCNKFVICKKGVDRKFEQILKNCKFVFTDGETNACCDCGDVLSILGSDCIGVRVDDRDCTVYIDGLDLRKKLRVATCNIPPIPTSDDPNDFIKWKSLMDDFIGDCPRCPIFGEECVLAVCAAIEYFIQVLQSKIDGCEEGDVWCTFSESENELLDLLDPSNLQEYKNSIFTPRTFFKASDVSSGDEYGLAVEISGDGRTVANSAPKRNSSRGAVYINSLNEEDEWVEDTILVGSTIAINDQFGTSTALSTDGNTLVVGVPNKGTGVVYVFNRDENGDWSEHSILIAPTTAPVTMNVQFGSDVRVSGDGSFIVVADRLASTPNPNAGAVHVYQLQSGVWVEIQSPLTLNVANNRVDDLALSRDGLVLVYTNTINQLVFNTFNGTTFDQTQIINLAFVSSSNRLAIDDDGEYVALSRSSQVDVFKRNGTWSLLQTIVTGNNETIMMNDAGDVMAVAQPDNGKILIFNRDGDTFTQTKTIDQVTCTNQQSIDSSGKHLLLGTSDEGSDTNTINGEETGVGADNSGAAYLYCTK